MLRDPLLALKRSPADLEAIGKLLALLEVVSQLEAIPRCVLAPGVLGELAG
jgi:hypothetical protein